MSSYGIENFSQKNIWDEPIHNWRLVITMLLHGLDIRSEKYSLQFGRSHKDTLQTSLLSLLIHFEWVDVTCFCSMWLLANDRLTCAVEEADFQSVVYKQLQQLAGIMLTADQSLANVLCDN